MFFYPFHSFDFFTQFLCASTFRLFLWQSLLFLFVVCSVCVRMKCACAYTKFQTENIALASLPFETKTLRDISLNLCFFFYLFIFCSSSVQSSNYTSAGQNHESICDEIEILKWINYKIARFKRNFVLYFLKMK